MNQVQRATYYMMPLIRNVHKKEVYKDRKQIRCCCDLAVGMGINCKRKSFGNDGNVLKLEFGNVPNSISYLESIELYAYNFMLYELYLNRVVL